MPGEKRCEMGRKKHRLCGADGDFRDDYFQAVKMWGWTAQEMVLAEECAELAAAYLRKGRTNRPEALEQFYEECADVSVMIDQLLVAAPLEIRQRVLEKKAKKLAMLREKLSAEEGD